MEEFECQMNESHEKTKHATAFDLANFLRPTPLMSDSLEALLASLAEAARKASLRLHHETTTTKVRIREAITLVIIGTLAPVLPVTAIPA